MESMQASLEAETKAKTEAMRAKKKLEQDINELEAAADGANRGRAEAEKTIKRLQAMLADLQRAADEEKGGREEAVESLAAAERRFEAAAAETEDLRTELEGSERARKTAEGNMHEANDRVAELTSSVSSLSATKKKFENDVLALQVR